MILKRGVEKKIGFENLSEEEKGYLKGLFIGDGYKYHDLKYRKYYIEFYLNPITNNGIIVYLKKLINKCRLNHNVFKDKRFNCLRIRITNKEFFDNFTKDISQANLNNSQHIGFISGLIDAEGYVDNKRSSIKIANTDLKMLKLANKILKNLNINSRICEKTTSKKDKKQGYRLYVSVKFKRLSHVSIKAGMPQASGL